MARDNNIYGLDPTEYAASIAQDALTPKTISGFTKGMPNLSGYKDAPSEVVVVSDKADSRADSKGNH